MKNPLEKDLYSILGVDPSASPDEIREAYRARTRVLHPDRFDRQDQPQDWKKANEMLGELNEAYSILQNASSRAEYDRGRAKRYKPQNPTPNPKPQSPPPSFELGELTPGKATFGSLPKNVQARLFKRQKNQGEDQFQVKLDSVGWSYLFILVLLCWFWYLFADADGAKWKGNTLLWYAGITVTVGLLIGRNLTKIRRWAKSALKPYFYVTPIYFIKTEYDTVFFRPLWTLKDVAVTHNYRNGIYQNTSVILKFDGHHEPFSLSSEQEVETLFERMRRYDAQLRTAYANRDHQYFLNNDDFCRVPRSGIPTATPLSKGRSVFIYGASVFLCTIGLFAAIGVNEDLSQKRQHVIKPFYPEQPLPVTGSVRTYKKSPMQAPFEIKAKEGSHYLLKLVDAHTDALVLTVFVRSGTTVEIEVPLGTYEVRYASGNSWYGYEYLFGPETVYSKADKTFVFERREEKIMGFTITLYTVPGGNLHLSNIQPTEF